MPAIRDEYQAHELDCFVPLRSFWTAIEPFKHIEFIDCGAGNGQLTAEMSQRGFKVRAVDIRALPSAFSFVERDDALTCGFSETCWPIIACPGPGTWHIRLIHKALVYRANAFYVGFDSEIERDLTDFSNMTKKLDIDTGRYGESLVLIDRSKSDRHRKLRKKENSCPTSTFPNRLF
jgi:hypothetical protein